MSEIKYTDDMLIKTDSESKKPFTEADLKDVFSTITSPSEVTSIPSPYAQMHLFNMAFFAASAYTKNKGKSVYESGTNEYLYDKLISHNLDIFELLFYWDELNLDQKGFSIERFELPDDRTLKDKNSSREKDKHRNFRKTLDLYISRYKKKCDLTGEDAFDCGYYIRHNHKIIAITSPLTGFYVSASADFGQDGIQDLWNDRETIVYLSNDNDTFRPLHQREEKFRIFLHKIIAKFCPKGYTYFKDYIKGYAGKGGFDTETQYNNDDTVDMAKYGFSDKKLLDLIKTAIIDPDKTKKNENNVIVIPDRYNKIYFHSLLQVDKSISFNLTADDYKENLNTRKRFGDTLPWLSVNDFFQKDIIELDDTINKERFYCCTVKDSNDKDTDVKILLPLKDTYFQYLNYVNDDNKNLIGDRLTVKLVSDERYVAMLKVPTKVGDITLCKEYLLPKQNEAGNLEYPSASIVQLVEDTLYMGIYPFVKDTENKENNGFFRIFTYHSKKLTSNLKFFKDTDKGLAVIENKDKERHITKKSYRQDFEHFPISTFYALEKRYFDKDNAFNLSKDKDVDFEVVKIILGKDSKNYEALLIPKFIQKQCTSNSGMLSVDFGTSNTNISIGTDGGAKKVFDYDSYISDEKSLQISQVVMLHKPKDGKFDFKATAYGAPNQNHLLSEFMPAVISKDHEHYRFALPSVINLHEDKMDAKSVSLVHANIPVAYYSKGLRKMNDSEIDKPFANFKWTENNKQKELYVYLFIDQLLLMARNLLLADRQNPKNTVLVYSTPLSMKDTEKNFYDGLWHALGKKYFDENNLRNISESRAPYYASGKAFGANSTILLDVGGGSTDILFYQNEMVKATTSYAYAANGLFAGLPKENIFMKQMPRKASDDKEQGMNEVEENATMSVCDIFNYRFAKKEYAVKNHFLASSEWKYLLTLHCSALLYHAVQNNKAIIGNDDIPLRNILFSGNGAKLFKLLNGIDTDSNDKLEKLAKYIVRYVYSQNTNKTADNEEVTAQNQTGNSLPPLEISFVDDNWVSEGVTLESTVGMKAATSIGSICWQMDLKKDKGQDTDPKVIPIGDEESCLKTADLINDVEREKWNAENSEKQKEIIKKVSENFNLFLDGFLGKEDGSGNTLFDCGLRTFVDNPINGKEVRSIITDKDLICTSIEDYHIKYPIPEHSIFFVPLQRLIIELSKYFASKS